MSRREKHKDLQAKKAPSRPTQDNAHPDPSPSAQPASAPIPEVPEIPEYVIVQTGKMWWLYARADDTRMVKVVHNDLPSYTLEGVFKVLAQQDVDHFTVRVMRA